MVNTGDMGDFPIAIIGAGFSGLGMAIKLKEAGIESFTIFEKADDIGGTWRDNTYPGCACDVPSHLYSFSFDQNPRWSHEFSGQAEILEYLRSVVDRYDLRRFIRFGTEVKGASFDEDVARWNVDLSDGTTYEARVLISGAGPLNKPAYPDIAGRDTFEGEQFHSFHWNHDYDFRGKRVAAIGTGASAIQFVPEIAPDTEQLYVFQRTAPWIFPKPNGAYGERTKRAFERIPGLQRAYRNAIYWAWESRAIGFVKYPKLLNLASRMGRAHIAKQVADPELRAKVTPDFSVGCKRILGSDDWYPTLQRDDVELVTDDIVEIRARSIVTRDGVEREVDAIVYGTGFRVTDFITPMRVVGRGGVDINDAWRDGAEAYYGMSVSGFPNLFVLLGPNTGLGHNSVVFMAEAQIHWVMQHVQRLRREKLAWTDVKPAVQRKFNDDLQSRMAETVWLTGCQSWYLDEGGKNFSLWPGFTFEYWLRTRRVDWGAFEVSRASKERAHTGEQDPLGVPDVVARRV